MNISSGEYMIKKAYDKIFFIITKFDVEDILSSSGDNDGFVLEGDGSGGKVDLPMIMI